jgi:hypothetical protein
VPRERIAAAAQAVVSTFNISTITVTKDKVGEFQKQLEERSGEGAAAVK